MSLQDFLIHRSGLRSREALVERQKVKPAVQWGPDEPTARPGSFKVSSKMLKVMKDAGMEPDESLFPVQRKAITDIPQDKLPGLVGAKSMDKAQDVIAKSPRKAFNVFLRKLTKVSPKAGKMMRNVPQNNSLMFYVYVTRVSGRDMADIILKRYLTTHQAFKPIKPKREVERHDGPLADGSVIITESVTRFQMLAGVAPLPRPMTEMRKKSLRRWIRDNRAEIDAAIKRVARNVRKLNDDDREEWVMNDEGLYNWAKSEGVNV